MSEVIQAFLQANGISSVVAVIGAGSAIYISKCFKEIKDDFKRMGQSVEKLNLTLAKIVERVSSHEKRITRLEDNQG